jgi:hypothetical protein
MESFHDHPRSTAPWHRKRRRDAVIRTRSTIMDVTAVGRTSYVYVILFHYVILFGVYQTSRTVRCFDVRPQVNQPKLRYYERDWGRTKRQVFMRITASNKNDNNNINNNGKGKNWPERPYLPTATSTTQQSSTSGIALSMSNHQTPRYYNTNRFQPTTSTISPSTTSTTAAATAVRPQSTTLRSMSQRQSPKRRRRQKMKPMPILGYNARTILAYYDARPLEVGWRLNSLGFPLLGTYISFS